jgi:integrase
LSDDELAAVLAACDGLGQYGQGVKLLALTGARRSEVFGMTWQEIDFASKTWTLPAARAKNNRQHVIPLSAQAIAILQELESAKLAVFEPVSFSRMKAELDKLLPGIPAFTVHDLRRTAASGMGSLGVRIETVEKILNHSSGSFRGIVSVYQRYDFSSEKREALALWGAHVAELPAPPVARAAAA